VELERLQQERAMERKRIANAGSEREATISES
jgi:hypothetical protein